MGLEMKRLGLGRGGPGGGRRGWAGERALNKGCAIFVSLLSLFADFKLDSYKSILKKKIIGKQNYVLK